MQPTDWDLLQKWCELRTKIRDCTTECGYLAERQAKEVEKQRLLEQELSELEGGQSKDLQRLFRGLSELYASAPVWDSDEHTRAGIGPERDDTHPEHEAPERDRWD